VRFWPLGALVLIAACTGSPNRPAEFVSGDDPNYPAEAREKHMEGYVVVEYTVSAEGAVADARVVEAQPPQVFDQAALEAVARWRYTPRYVNGAPAAATGVRSTLTFKLGEAEDYEGY